MKIETVQATGDLPSSGQQDGDICFVADTWHYWIWDAGIWKDLGSNEEAAQEIARQLFASHLPLRRLGPDDVWRDE